MKKFIVKFLLLFTLILFSIGIINILYIKTNYWKESVINLTVKFKDIPDNIQIANVGSSHGVYDFDYSNVPYLSFNFALNSQLFLYDFALLRQYINRFDKNAVLLIPISYFQITRRKTDFQDQRARYYRFLAKEYMDFYSIKEKILFTYIPVLSAGNTLMFIIKDQPITPEFMTKSDLIEYCNKKHKQWTTDSEIDNVFEAGEKGFAYNQYLVSQIVEFCYENDIKPVLITTPITSILNNIYTDESPGFFETFYRFTRELQEAYPGLPYFDYSHDPRFENDFSLFRDGDHLNTAGAQKFTAIVISDLQVSGLIAPNNAQTF
jgi:hypothetical protein